MHKDLEVWKRAIDLVTQVYSVSKHYPRDEQFGLASQIRRAAVSIPSNIAEGAARNSSKEFVQFLYIALGSCSEVETQLVISGNLGYAYDENVYNNLQQIKKMIIGLIKKRKNENI
jgi:four helix bundle protein